jgi:hypothetical protein
VKYNDKSKALLDELLSPIPFFARPMAKKAMEREIFAEAEKAGHEQVQEEDVLRGYLVAGSKKDTDKDKMIKFLTEKGYDLEPYADLLA